MMYDFELINLTTRVKNKKLMQINEIWRNL